MGGLGLSTKMYEQRLLRVVRRLPPERVSQVIDFAQFLEFQTARVGEELLPGKGQSEENARWDALLATDESQRLLERMADKALADIQAGYARPMTFSPDGEIAPG